MTAEIIDVQERIIDLCKLITLPAPLGTTDAVKSEEDCMFEDDALPVFIVRRGPGIRHIYNDTSQIQSVREYLLRLYVLRICDDESPDANKETALALAAACIIPTLLFFAARRGLELAIDDGGIVENQSIVQDSGDNTVFSSNSETFSGVLFRMQVTTRHHAEGATLW